MMREGRLAIDLYRNGAGVDRVAIASSRPMGLAQVFEGKSPDETAAALPLLFSICASAQGRAGALAMERALGLVPCPVTEAARDALVGVETVRELLLGIAMTWPGYLGEPVDKTLLAEVNALLPKARIAVFAEAAPFAIAARAKVDLARYRALVETLERLVCKVALGVPAADFAAFSSEEDLHSWAESGDSVAARLVDRILREDWAALGDTKVPFQPELGETSLADRLFGEEALSFAARPEWRGTPCETTILSRRQEVPLVADILAKHGAGLLARLAARLVELASAPGDLRRQMGLLEQPVAPAATLRGEGTGLAQVAAARGNLVHAARIGDGQVLTYRIVAPTEWNFHPEGVAAQGLLGLKGSDEDRLMTEAGLLIDAIDPCVAYDLRVH